MKIDLNESLEKRYFREDSKLSEARTPSASNWRDIKKALNADKLDKATKAITDDFNKNLTDLGITAYLYRRRYKPEWLSLVYQIYLFNDADEQIEATNEVKRAIKVALAQVKKDFPDILKVGLLNGDDTMLLAYINLPYEAFKSDEIEEIPDGAVKYNDYDNNVSNSDYWAEMETFGYNPEADADW